MKYLFIQDSYYHFRRRIPNTTKNFTFKCKTKNGRIAIKITALFLSKAEPLFQILKSESTAEIMDNFQIIMNLLLEYRDKALIEYSEFEKERHTQFTCVSKKGKQLDGGHPKCIKKWLKTLQDAVYSSDPENNYKLYFNDIFKRTRIDESLYDTLSSEEKEIIQFETVKKEAYILSEDYYRAKQRFDPEYALQYSPAPTVIQPVQTSKHYEKTAREIADDFIRIKNAHTSEMHKYIGPIEIFLQVIDKKYLIDFTTENMQDFIFTMKNLPPQRGKENMALFDKFENDYLSLAKYVQENNLPTVSLKVAIEKAYHVIAMLDYAVSEERIDQNRLSNKYLLPSKSEKSKTEEKEKKVRVPFSDNELNKLFNESSWFTSKLAVNLQHEQDRLYIPLIGLLQGLRINEAAQLYLDDIIECDGVMCFRIDTQHPDQKVKNKTSRRIVPIHPKLIEVGFLDYTKELQKRGEKRIFPQLFFTNDKGYGQAFSKKFNNKKFKAEWIDLKPLENEKILKDFHSFRHTFASKMSGRVLDSQLDFLMGHEGKSENQKRYIVQNQKVLLEAIQKMDIAGVNFPSLKNS